MANSYVTYTGNGTLQTFNVTFPYISQSDVACQINGVPVAFTWPTSSSITLATIPGNGANVYIYRTTAVSTADVVWSDGTTIRAADLNLEVSQLLYGLQDTQDQAAAAINAALSKTSQLPAVGTPQNNDFLGVVSGAWSVVTPAAMATILGLGSAAFVNTGTAAGNVSLNSQLGGLAFCGLLGTGGLTTVGGNVYARGDQVLATDPGTPANGDRWYRSDLQGFKSYESSTVISEVHLLSHTASDSTTIANTAAMTACSQGMGIPANFLTPGKVLRVRCSGYYVSTGAPTLQLNICLNTVGAILDGVVFTADASGRFIIEATFTCRTTGTSGTWQLTSQFLTENKVVGMGGSEVSAISVNTTAANTIFPCIQWGTASASNTVVFRSLICETLDP